jgi:polygalacturonase
MIEHNYISCGDDHVTILSGTNGKGPPSKNVTVRHNKLGTGMGISVGSSVAGGVEDVLYQNNWMNQSVGEWGIGVHIKTRVQYGGYIRNVAYLDNYFLTAGVPGGAIHIESGYQSSGQCNATGMPGACTAISDIVFRNLTFVNAGGAGELQCFPAVPCHNITVENVHINTSRSGWGCNNVASGTFKDITVGLHGESFDMAKSCQL